LLLADILITNSAGFPKIYQYRNLQDPTLTDDIVIPSDRYTLIKLVLIVAGNYNKQVGRRGGSSIMRYTPSFIQSVNLFDRFIHSA
jgi:hypothetical protein